MKKRVVFIVLATVAVVAAGAVYYRSTHADTGPAPLTAAVTRGDVVEAVDATGTVEAVTTVQVGTQVSGTIQSLHADFNSKVRKGQVVARLDPSLFQTQVDQARATSPGSRRRSSVRAQPLAMRNSSSGARGICSPRNSSR